MSRLRAQVMVATIDENSQSVIAHCTGRCGFCNTMRFFFVNRGGQTKCTDGDLKEQTTQKPVQGVK